MIEPRYRNALEQEIATDSLRCGLALDQLRGWVRNVLPTLPGKTAFAFLIALAAGWAILQLPTTPLLDRRGLGFLATLAAGVILWVSEALDDYVVALLVFLAWIVLGVVPSNIALSGFSTESWFFLVAALGMTASVTRSGLFTRLALRLLSKIPRSYRKTYGVLLFMSGVLLTPLVPTGKARVTLLAPMLNAITQAFGFKSRSRQSAALVLTAYLGIGQMSFLCLTGGTENLGAWSVLPAIAKSEFGWTSWALAAFPAGVVIAIVSLAALHLMFPSRAEETGVSFSGISVQQDLQDLGSLKSKEWLSLGILAMAFIGWVTHSIHGISEVWIATGAFLFALVTGVLDKDTLRKEMDWGFVLFFGVICSMGTIADKLRIDRWLGTLTEPLLSLLVSSPLAFLMAVALIVSIVRLFLRKTAAYIFATLTLISWAPQVGIHPGILVLTIVMAGEGWFFHYQDGSYQMVYSMTGGKAFSHSQARKLMAAKFAAVFIALLVCVPYWRFLGLIH